MNADFSTIKVRNPKLKRVKLVEVAFKYVDDEGNTRVSRMDYSNSVNPRYLEEGQTIEILPYFSEDGEIISQTM